MFCPKRRTRERIVKLRTIEPGVTINTTLHKKYKSKCQLGREVLSEELGLQKVLKGREGRACSGSARQFVPPIDIYTYNGASMYICLWFHQRGTTWKFWIAVLAQTAVPNDAHYVVRMVA